jgi:hypothetical protein
LPHASLRDRDRTLRVSKGHLKLFAAIIALQAVILALVMAAELRSGSPQTFPASLAVATSAPSSRNSVPISYTTTRVGRTTTAALAARGGRAVATSPGRNSGTVGYAGFRRIAGPRTRPVG